MLSVSFFQSTSRGVYETFLMWVFFKTGTKSMALALRDLGYSVHDFEEHLEVKIEKKKIINKQK